jgi:hypothetical protein
MICRKAWVEGLAGGAVRRVASEKKTHVPQRQSDCKRRAEVLADGPAFVAGAGEVNSTRFGQSDLIQRPCHFD